MNKNDFVKVIAEKVEITKADSEKYLTAVLDSIIETVSGGDSIKLVGFGTFESKERAARTGRNPKTKEEVSIAAKRVPAFKPGKDFKDAVMA